MKVLPHTELSKEQLDKIDNDEWFRAGGECECPICGKLYKQHQCYEFSDMFHLNLICTGDFVKL